MGFWPRLGLLLLLSVGALEVVCRLAIGHAPRLRFDPHYDRLPAPNQLVVQSTEGFSRGRTNELGNLDAPMPTPLPADAILVLGDSYTEARQVAQAERFTNRLGAALGRRVYNVGHTGWSPINSLEYLTIERDRFRPAVVVVQVSGNDLNDIVAVGHPHIVEGEHGFEIVLPNRAKRGLARRITSVREAVSRSAFVGDLIVAALQVFAPGVEGDGETTCQAADPLAIRAVPWLIAQLHQAGPAVHLLYLPTLDYHADCTDRCDAARVVFERAAAAAAVPFVDATPALCRRFRATGQPLHGFWNTVLGVGHLNADGHEVVADLLAARLGAEGGPR